MIQKILVPLDGTILAEGIIAPLVRLLPAGSEVTLLQVSEPGTPSDAAPLGAQGHAEVCSLVTVEESLSGRFRTTIVVRRGDPAEEIVRFARESGQQLIAMATHGRAGVDRLLHGSVAERVLRTADVPLLLCNPLGARREGPLRKLLVALDGSAAADRILPVVLELGRAHGARAALLRVEPLVVTELPSPLLVGSLWDPSTTALSLAPQRDRLRAAGLDVETIAAYGLVAQEILRESGDCDLLAMTTHGRTGASRLLFGSVAEHVLRHATCPLLVLRTA